MPIFATREFSLRQRLLLLTMGGVEATRKIRDEAHERDAAAGREDHVSH
jgi:hypothetical protein